MIGRANCGLLPPPTQTKSVSYTANGSYSVLPDAGKVLDRVNVNVNVSAAQQSKTANYTANGTYYVTPDAGYLMNQVVVNINVPNPDVGRVITPVEGTLSNQAGTVIRYQINFSGLTVGKIYFVCGSASIYPHTSVWNWNYALNLAYLEGATMTQLRNGSEYRNDSVGYITWRPFIIIFRADRSNPLMLVDEAWPGGAAETGSYSFAIM